MTAPLLTLSVPLLDTSISIVRRFLRHQPIFGADRAHIHHKLLSRGFTTRRVVLLLYTVCGISAGASLLLTTLHPQYQNVVIILVCIVAAIGLHLLDYAEFRVAGKAVLEGSIRRLVAAQIDLETFERELAAAKDLEQCWDLIRSHYERFGFSHVSICLGGTKEDSRAKGRWHVQLDFSEYGYIRLYRSENSSKLGAAALLFVDCISRILPSRLDALLVAQVTESHFNEVNPIGPVTFMTQQ
jgi:UDP-GlcNAc:undecaprenyl-phosphate GlcNAc-1-phosphate transferase